MGQLTVCDGFEVGFKRADCGISRQFLLFCDYLYLHIPCVSPSLCSFCEYFVISDFLF